MAKDIAANLKDAGMNTKDIAANTGVSEEEISRF